MNTRHLERMKAIVAQAVAEAENAPDRRVLGTVHLIVYGDVEESEIRDLYRQACAGTECEQAEVIIEDAGSRYICWNCCGLRFESEEGVCPNCGDEALEIPEDIAFALRNIELK